MSLHRTFALAFTFALLPVIAAAQKTTYDYDKRVIGAIEAQMAAKGLTKDDGAPDVYVVYHLAFDQQKDISSFSSGPMYGGYGWGWGGGWGTTTTDVRVREILVGTLAIDLIDAKKKQVAWRGLGTKEIDTHAKPEKRDSNINKAVEKIFKNYPPKVKK